MSEIKSLIFMKIMILAWSSDQHKQDALSHSKIGPVRHSVKILEDFGIFRYAAGFFVDIVFNCDGVLSFYKTKSQYKHIFFGTGGGWVKL